jgi:hypothetical protein
MPKIKINEGYELYQVIKDFGDPLEIFREGIQNAFDEDATEIYINVYEKRKISGDELIIDILDNGHGMRRDNVANFFDVANSSKVTSDYIPKKSKHGYKGHGSKVFFNANEVVISSKNESGDSWAVRLEKPLEQIADKKIVEYSDFFNPNDVEMDIPQEWESGFMVRIISPRYFASEFAKYKLTHIYLRDYCNWYTIIGTVETLYNNKLNDRGVKLFLRGLKISEFKNKFSTPKSCDPFPAFVDKPLYGSIFEKISLGHYFPDKRTDDSQMKRYADNIGSNKAIHMFYSNLVLNEEITTGNLTFRLIIGLEGYETKRRYDLLLTRQGSNSSEINHTDGERYGIWACKGGVPIEKIDDWIEGGRGVGTYTYLHAFVDCNEFELTSNRGSIRNTDIQKQDQIRKEINRIFQSKKIKDAFKERQDWEELEKNIKSIKSDEDDLKKRYDASRKRRKIELPDGTTLLEPTKTRNGYSESETFVVLLSIMEHYPELFPFKLLDYNTTSGIDFVVEERNVPKYIELKGTMKKTVNHPFRHIYKFICYDIDVNDNDIIEDLEFATQLKIDKDYVFESTDLNFNGKKYTGHTLFPVKTGFITSMEIIRLKTFLVEVVGAKIT